METGSGRYEGREAIHDVHVVGRRRVAPADRRRPSESIGTTPTEEWVARGRLPFIRHYTATTQIDVLSETLRPGAARTTSSSPCTVSTTGAATSTNTAPIDGRWLITHRREITDAAFEGGWVRLRAGGGR